MKVSRDIASPRYYQVYVTLRQWVRDGTYRAGQQIPTEAQLCRSFEVSRITIRKAIDELVREGWLVRHQGRGTFVDIAAARANVSADVSQVLSHVAEFGQQTGVRGLKVAEVDPDEETRAALELGDDERVQKATHVRMLNNSPLGHVTTFVPRSVAERIDASRLSSEPMLRLLERSGIRVGTAEQFIGATLAEPEVARALKVPVGSPLVRITRVIYDMSRRPVERVIALYRADRYHYRMHLSREGRQASSDWVAA
ncbi:MAG TPA: GntR family transcriptional regulator [Steroidobacteraceae bacterium]|nr:GntR family transcriptional regulator [Steroidobacteraceae bacterium]